MGSLEWPLIIFTVLGEAAVGMIFALWWISRKPLDSGKAKKITLISGILIGVGLLASLFHLGHPEASYRALTHLSTSWLSREILSFMLISLGICYLFWQTWFAKGKYHLAAGITSLLGIIGIFSSAMGYALPRVPAWNSASTFFFFLLTAVILGCLIVLWIARKHLSLPQNRQLLLAALGALIAEIAVFILYISMLNQMGDVGVSTATLLTSGGLFAFRIIFWIVSFVLFFFLLYHKKSFGSSVLLLLLLSCTAVEFIGRISFYLNAIGIHINALF